MSTFRVTIKDAKFAGENKQLIRFTLGWEVGADGKFWGDEMTGCLARIDNGGRIVWSPHQTNVRGTWISTHTPTPDWIEFVRDLLDKKGVMKPLLEDWELERGPASPQKTLPDILEEVYDLG